MALPLSTHPATVDALRPEVAERPAPLPLPLRELLPWVVFAGLLLVMALYFVGAEQGAVSVVGGHWVHEFVHDARHVMAFPCH